MMYFLVNFRYQISHRCRNSWKNAKRFQSFDRTFYNSILRHIWSQLIIEFRFVRFCNFRIDVWFNFLVFTSFHVEKVCSKISNNTSLKKSHRWENSRSHFVEKVYWQWQSFLFFNKSRIYRVEKICTKVSKHVSLKKIQN